MREQQLELIETLVFDGGFYLAEKKLKLMVGHDRDLLVGQVFLNELVDVFFDGIARGTGEFTDLLLAFALGVKTQDLSDTAHEYCFVGHVMRFV